MNRLLIFLLSLFIVGQLAGQETRSFSMEEAISFGLDNHQEMKLASNELKRAREQMVEATSMGLPQINAGVDYSHFIKLPTSLVPAEFFGGEAGSFAELQFGTKNSLKASATLSTLLFDGTYLTALKASKRYINFAKINYENSERNLRNQIKTTYLPPLLLQENIKTIAKNVSSLDKLLNETNEMYKAGFVEKMDVDKLSLTVENMKVLKKDLEKNYSLAVDALKMQIGYPLKQEISLTETIEGLSDELDEEVLTIKMDYASRIEYNVLKHSEELSKLNIDRYKRGYWPSLSGFVTYQQEIQGENLLNDPFSSPISIAGLSLKIPVFDGLYKDAKIQQAKLDLDNVRVQQHLLEDGIDFQVKAARKNYFNALENIELRKKNLELAENIFNTSQDKYKEGVGSSLEIIQSEQSLHDSQQNYLNALYNFIIAKIDVEMAFGRE